jgi:FkbM family methyltransferase
VIRKTLPADFGGGPVFCSPDALLSTWKPGWRSRQVLHLFNWARRYVRGGDVVWDIGANQGLFAFAALAAAAPHGRVFAVEPDPFLTGLLHRTRRARAVEDRCAILPVAVARYDGLAELTIARKDRALNHLVSVPGNPDTEGTRETMTVVTVNLSWLAQRLPRPDLIKIDVEGSELDVLLDGGRLLQEIRPRWIIEVSSDHADAIGHLLRGAEYRLFNADQPGEALSSPAWNTLAVPAEQTSELDSFR